jgi:two-component system, chemotaxis family, protein-glutamate methylesterase/glutaminase
MKPLHTSQFIEAMPPAPHHHNPINVLVVDDKVVMRSMIKRILAEDKDIHVVSSAVDGAAALGQLNVYDIDVAIFSINILLEGGMTVIPNLMAAKPYLKVILITTTSAEHINTCMKAFEHGATDYIAKPNGKDFSLATADFQLELINKIKTCGDENRRKRTPTSPSAKSRVATPAKLLNLSIPKQIVLRGAAIPKPNAIAIGSSTGGPQALLKIIPHLKDITQPVFITQHMPAAFTPILAEHLTECGALPCYEAKDGMKVEPATIYLAPGNYHMTVKAEGHDLYIRLNQEAQENFCRPAIDPMLRSLSAYYGNNLFITILTGMGVDGHKGAKIAIESGASMIAQNEATSVVWGMPAAVAQDGLCHAVLPIDDIGPAIARIARMGQQ